MGSGSRPLELKILGDAGQLQRELQKAAGQLNTFARDSRRSGQAAAAGAAGTEGAFRRSGKAADTYAGKLKRVAKFAAGAFALGAVVSQAKQAISATEELGKSTLTLSKSFGMSVDTASRWAAVSKARGADGKQLSMGFKALSTQIRQANEGSEAQIKAFRELGISAGDLKRHGDDLDWVLGRVADGMMRMPAGTERAAISAKLFGRTWLTIAPLIRGGSQELDAQLALAEKYGATLKGKTIKDIQGMIVAQRESELATLGLKVAIGTTLIPALTELTEHANKFTLRVTDDWPQIKDTIEDITGPLEGLGRTVGGFVENNPDVAKMAASFAIIGAGAVKLSKLTGAGGLVKLAFGRGNTPLTPMYVKDVAGGGGLAPDGKPGKKPTPLLERAAKSPIVAVGGPVAATGFAAAANQSQAFKAGPTIGTGLPAGGGGLTGWLRRTVGEKLGIEDPKPLDTSGFTNGLKEMSEATARTREKIDEQLGPRLRATLRRTNLSWRRLGADTSTSMEDIRSNVSSTMRRLSRTMGSETLEGRIAMGRNITLAVDTIQRQMSRGEISTASGLREIRRLFASELKLFGFSAEQSERFASGQEPLTGKNLNTQSPGGRAVGGWIGSPGQAGHDTVPALLGVGEAVLNRHQQKPVEQALRATYGFGLDDLFQRVSTPHYLAGGGRIPDQRFPTGMGTLTTLGQRVLDRTDSAAEARLAHIAATMPELADAAGGGVPSGLAPQVRRALEWARAHGWNGRVTSGRRSTAKQQWLWDNAGRLGLVRGISVAKPGTSMHERGLAVDVTDWQGFKSAMQGAPAGARLIWRGPSDVVHFSTTGHAKGGWASDAPPGTVSGARGAARRAQLKLMKQAWAEAAPFFGLPRTAPMVATSFLRDFPFVGMSQAEGAKGRGYDKGRLLWPDWIWQGRDKLPQATLLSLMVHEWAHAFQHKGLSGSDSEGGATLFARRVAPQVAKALGIPYSQPFDQDQYVGEMKRAKKHGEAWIMRGQFAKPRGAQVPASVSKFAKGGRVTYERLQGLWRQAGGSVGSQAVAAAVAMAESGGDPRALNRNADGSVDRGLWQINSVHGALSTFDPLGNARAAVRISKRGTDWKPWVAYANGEWRKHLKKGLPADTSELRKKVPLLGAISGQAPKKPTGYVYVNGKKTAVYGPSQTDSVRPGGWPTVPPRPAPLENGDIPGSFLRIPETVAGMGGNAAAIAQGATPGANVEGGSGTGQPAAADNNSAAQLLAVLEEFTRNQRILIDLARTQPNQFANAILEATSGGLGARVNTMSPAQAGLGVRH